MSSKCLACTGGLVVPEQIELGSFPPGTRVPVRFTVRNPGKRSIEFPVSTGNPALSLLTRRLNIRALEEAAIIGVLAIGAVPPGQRSYRIQFETPTPLETVLHVQVVPAHVRLDFVPPELILTKVLPGTTTHRTLILNNTGNVLVTANLTTSDFRLTVQPSSVALAPGESSPIKVTARTLKADYGMHSGQIRVEPAEGYSLSALVRLQLPEPKLTAQSVDFGTVSPDQPSYQSAVIRNIGKVRVACTLSTDQPWLVVSPNRLNLPVDGEKEVKLRALIPSEEAGPKNAHLLATFTGGELLKVPVTIDCRGPTPVLGSIRKQTLGSVASDEVVLRRFSVTNMGEGRLKCKVEANQPWLEILTKEISISSQKKRRIEYRIDAPGMTRGVNRATIHITSNGGNADIPLSIDVVNPEPKLDLLGDLNLGTIETEDSATGHLLVRNSGVGMLRLQVRAEDGRVKVNPSEIALAAGPPAKIPVAISLNGLPGGRHTFTIRFAGNGGNGVASVHFKLPIEEINAPAELDLGNQLGGSSEIDSVRLLNTGPDEIKLAISADDPWIQPLVDTIAVRGGEIIAVPFRINFRPGFSGEATTALWLVGRTIRHKVAIHAVARTIELRAKPNSMVLGKMVPGEERAVVLQVSNRGDMAAEIRDLHIPGDLEIWIRRQAIQPGATVPLVGRVRMNSRAIGRQVGSSVLLTGDTSIQLSAMVGRQRNLPIISLLPGSAGILAGLAFWAGGNGWIGALAAVIGLGIAAAMWLIRR